MSGPVSPTTMNLYVIAGVTASHGTLSMILLPVSDICRLQTADCRPQTADYRLQTAYNGPQTVDLKTC